MDKRFQEDSAKKVNTQIWAIDPKVFAVNNKVTNDCKFNYDLVKKKLNYN